MSQYSVLNQSDLIEICRQYDIKGSNSFILLSGGSENTNYLISSASGKFVLTICEQKTAQSASELASVLEHLAENDFETSKLVRTTEDEPITVFKGKPVMLKVFIEGDIIKDLTSALLEKIGLEIGKLHQIEAPAYLPKTLNYGIEFFHEVEDYAAGTRFELWLKDIQTYIQAFFFENIPKALIHSDIFFSNIIVSHDRRSAFIMDFEEATYYYRIFDLGMSIVGLCCDGASLNLGKAKALLKGYQKEIELSTIEKRSLQAFTVYAAAAMCFWRHRNFNHINPDPEMYDHYLALKHIADSIRDIPANHFHDLLD